MIITFCFAAWHQPHNGPALPSFYTSYPTEWGLSNPVSREVYINEYSAAAAAVSYYMST